MKKNAKILVWVVILALAGVLIYYWNSGGSIVVEPGNGVKPPPANSDKKEPPVNATDTELILLSRIDIMKYAAANIAKLSPVQPVLGGKWFVSRFWFASGEKFYAEYEDGHILRKILITASGTKQNPRYEVTAYFEPGESDWALKQGKDTIYGQPLDLYEYDEAKKVWVKKN